MVQASKALQRSLEAVRRWNPLHTRPRFSTRECVHYARSVRMAFSSHKSTSLRWSGVAWTVPPPGQDRALFPCDTRRTRSIRGLEGPHTPLYSIYPCTSLGTTAFQEEFPRMTLLVHLIRHHPTIRPFTLTCRRTAALW